MKPEDFWDSWRGKAMDVLFLTALAFLVLGIPYDDGYSFIGALLALAWWDILDV